ncbi:MAG TPA: hypothetical protein VF128_15825 [Gemmatimonadaceae bacterium]
MNPRTERRFRLIAAYVAVIALLQALMVIPAQACERDHDSFTAAASSATELPMEHSSGDSDCGQSSSQSPRQHGNACQISCLSMAGCGTLYLVTGQSVVDMARREASDPLTLVQAYPSRSLEPDRPPPRS